MHQPCEPFACEPCCDVDGDETIYQALDVATLILWRLTGRKFGVCEATVALCPPDDCRCGGMVEPRLVDGKWYNCCADTGGTDGRLKLPLSPVIGVCSVTMNGVDRTEDVQLVHHKYLELCDGEAWPTFSGNCGCDSGSQCSVCDPSFTVTYNYGREVPQDLAWATSVLGCELWKRGCDDDSCRLPSNVTTVSRQGVTQQFQDPSSIFASGRTGINEVDMVIMSLGGRRNPGRVVDPLNPRARNWTHLS